MASLAVLIEFRRLAIRRYVTGLTYPKLGCEGRRPYIFKGLDAKSTQPVLAMIYASKDLGVYMTVKVK